MSEFFAHNEFEQGWDRETGKPGIALVANAILFWMAQQNADPVPTISDAAAAFDMADADVSHALEWHQELVAQPVEGE